MLNTLNTLLRHLRISRKPEENQDPGNPDGVEVSAAIETATEAMKKLIDSTLAAVSEIREMVSSILHPLPEVIQKAYKGLRFVIGWLTPPPPNIVSGNAN
jgi:hypothetical protein